MGTRIRAVLIIVIGLLLVVVGLGAGYLLLNRLNTQTAAAQKQPEVVKNPVVVLTRDMKLGDRIATADVSISQIPVEVIPRDAISTLEAAVGRIIKADMVQGEMVLQHNLADPTNNNHDLSFILSEDHVLMAFPATDLMSTENVPQRGDVIDILATFTVTVKTPAINTTLITEGTPTPTPNPPVKFTVDAFQKLSITALVLDVISQQSSNNTGLTTSTSKTQTTTVKTNISSYLLALNPQDALVLKHLKDMDAVFDIVIRNPLSKMDFSLTPVYEQYLVELYGLQLLP